MMEKCFLCKNNYQQMYLRFCSFNFLNFCTLTLKFGNKTGTLENIIDFDESEPNFLENQDFLNFFIQLFLKRAVYE